MEIIGAIAWAVLAIFFLPFYVYVLSKCAAMGSLQAIKQFTAKEVKIDNP